MTSKKELLSRYRELWIECNGNYPPESKIKSLRAKDKASIKQEICFLENRIREEQSMFDYLDDDWYTAGDEDFAIL